MSHYSVPAAVNEPVLNYAPGSPERKALKAALAAMRKEKAVRWSPFLKRRF